MSIFYIFRFLKNYKKIYRTYFYRGIIIYEYEVQEINPVQSKVAKQNTPVDEKSCVKKDQPEIQQNRL